jgi:hypothetical protein
MILIIGPLADSSIAHLTLLLLAREIDFQILDPRTYTQEWDLVWELDNGGMKGYIDFNDKRIDMAEISAVWNHMITLPEDTGQSGICNDSLAGLVAFADAFVGLVVNRPSVASSNSSKPYQQAIITRHGFAPIKTLITTVPQEAEKFYEQCGGDVVFKSISWRRSIVKRMTPADMDRLSHVCNCPTQFQQCVPGTDVRVHTAGKQLFATEITSSSVDYRYVPADGERDMRAIDLPPEIEANCLSLADELDMVISGIDLRRGPDGEYYCFEANPIPGYLFYERQTGQPIGEAFADLLSEAECEAKGSNT